MTRSYILVLYICAIAVTIAHGCDDDDNGASSERNPPTGVWSYDGQGVEENTCGTEDVFEDPDTNFILTNNGDGTFTVDQGAVNDFDCTITGNNFSCPERLYGEFPVAVFDVTLSYITRINGTFSSDTAASGTQRMDIECDGAGCGLANTFGYTLPCYYTVNFASSI